MRELKEYSDPLKLGKLLWPDITLYREQVQTFRSVWETYETVVCAGNMLGKDFLSAMLVILFFLTRIPCRIVTTSVDGSQLQAVLWGEMRRFIQTSRIPLEHTKGGPLVINHMMIRRIDANGSIDGLSYILGRVAAKGEGFLGHHIAKTDDGIPRTLLVGDEASGLDDVVDERGSTWAHRKLYIGNPFPCNNFFKKAAKAGNLVVEGRLHRRVIKIKATDSPNVRYALAEQSAGRRPSGRIILPGPLTWQDYLVRRATYDEIRQCVSLDAEFYEGGDVLMFPPQWLNRAEEVARRVPRLRAARAIGVDPGEGKSDTAFAAVDERGIIELKAYKTPDTDRIVNDVIAFGARHAAPPENWMLDRGGGGKQIADRLRNKGYPVRTVPFGEMLHAEPKRGITTLPQKIDIREEHYTYKTRRSQMYGELRELLDPANGTEFGIPAEYTELRRQLAPLPLLFDGEGRLDLIPKNRPTIQRKWAELSGKEMPKKPTMVELIGCSPDEADAVVLAVHGMLHRRMINIAGAV